MEAEFDFLSVEVAVESEEVGFDGSVLVSNGGSDTDVNGGWIGGAVEGGLGGVDAVGGDGEVFRFEVGGGESE